MGEDVTLAEVESELQRVTNQLLEIERSLNSQPTSSSETQIQRDLRPKQEAMRAELRERKIHLQGLVATLLGGEREKRMVELGEQQSKALDRYTRLTSYILAVGIGTLFLQTLFWLIDHFWAKAQ